MPTRSSPKEKQVRARANSVQIVVAIIGLIGMIITAFLTSPYLKDLLAAWTNAPATSTPTDPCSTAKIFQPTGADLEADAVKFPVSNAVKISWKPSNCIMIIQYYQGTELKNTYNNVPSDTIIDIVESGATEIKIWRLGYQEQFDNVWVWVGDK